MMRCWAVGLTCVLLAPMARAQESDTAATAGQFFRAGLAAYDRHEYRAAALAFEEAYRRAPRGAAIYNAGRGWEAAGDTARAADAFAAAVLGGDLDAHDGQYAREHLAALEPSLAVVEITGPPTATALIDGALRGALPHRFHVTPGAHSVEVRRQGGSDIDRHVAPGAGESVALAIEDVRANTPPRVEPRREAPLPPTPPSSALWTWGWIALGATVVLGGAGTATYVAFASDRSTFDGSGDRDASLHDAALHYRTATYVLWSAAGACAVAGALLVLTTRSSPATVRVGLGWAGASVAF